jgi:hypothetical protein
MRDSLSLLFIAAAASAQPPPPPPPPAAAPSYCSWSGGARSWSPGDLEPSTGQKDTATNTVTICSGEGIATSGSLVAIDYWAVAVGSTAIQIWRQAGTTSTGFELVCKTDVTTTTTGLHHVPISPPCAIRAGDFPVSGTVVSLRRRARHTPETVSAVDTYGASITLPFGQGFWQQGTGIVAWHQSGPALHDVAQAEKVTTEPQVGQQYTVHKVAYPRNSSVQLYICGPMLWGWPLIGLATFASAVYVGGGVAWGRRTRGVGGGGGPLSSHPHYESWRELGSLCTDGMHYARGRLLGGGGGSGKVDRGRLLADESRGGARKGLKKHGRRSGEG